MEEEEEDLEPIELEPDPYQILVDPPTVPENVVDLKHSFGYDCKRLFNLCLLDDDTLMFASGNLLHYYSVSKNEFTLRRTVGGGGVGFLTKNHVPEFNYLTIAENGLEPIVYIYKYPEYEVITRLVGGAVRSFTTGVYSNNGEFLATLAGHPDFMHTIWNWQTSSIVLRAKAYQNDVLSVAFSQFNPILLASCGLSHVQFWKMALTFTGLKLKSDLSRFGKTDTCDVFAVYMLADEKVISGSEWGNMLLWEGGLIKFEVTRKARKPCHMKPITKIMWMGNNEVMTIGMDGYARIWFWETVELADPPEEDLFVEIDPIFEFYVGTPIENCEMRHLVKAKPDDETSATYYAQDGNGGVWFCDFNTSARPLKPKKLFSCHGGRIMAAEPSPISSHIATLGDDGKINIYNYKTEELLIQQPFKAPGGDLLWLDTSIDPSGMVMFVGFQNGVLRVVLLELDEKKTPKAKFHLLYAIKPHAVAITRLGISPSKDMLVSCALDNTAFLYHIKTGTSQFVEIVTLGYLLFDGSPLCINWNINQPRTALFGCHSGEVYECELPPPETIDLVKVRPTWQIYALSLKKFKFTSVKSKIRRDLELAAKMVRKENKLRRKKKEMKRLMQLNPGLQMDENALADSSEDEGEEEELYIPDPPNPVLWVQYTNQGTVWLSMGGYDSGYIYEVKFGESLPVCCTLIPEADDIEIHSYLYIDDLLIFGMQTGHIRVNRVQPDFRLLNDFWMISMHDNLNGVIPRIFTSHDGEWFFSIGYDGNVFYYYWKGPVVPRYCEPPAPFKPPAQAFADIEDPNYLSLEEVKMAENLVKLRAFEEAERKRLEPSFAVMQLQVDWIVDKTRDMYQAKLTNILRKMERDVSGASRDAQNLFEEMFVPLEYIPFEVYAIRGTTIIRAFRQPKLIVEEYIEEPTEEGENEENESAIADIPVESATTLGSNKQSRSRLAVKIYDFTEKVLLKLYIRILEFFALLKQIKSEEVERVVEICGDVSEGDVVEQSNLSFDEELGEEEQYMESEEEEPLLERAIRFLNNEIPENVEVKNLEINILREILYIVRSQFNGEVLRLKTYKTKLYTKYEKLKQDMVEQSKFLALPELPAYVMYHEYPDVILKEPFIPLRSFESILWEKPMKKTAEQLAAELEEDIKESELNDMSAEGEGEDEYVIEEEPSEEWIPDDESVLDKIDGRIVILDTELLQLSEKRPQYEIETRYLDYLLEITLKELVILEDSETMEKYLVERDESAKMRRNRFIATVQRLKTEIDDTIKDIATMNMTIKQIASQFYSEIKGNKFFKFLKRIFDKKFRPQRPKGSDEETESESSSDEETTEDEEEAGSGESGEMTAIHLDESHCPPGCDRALYDLSFEMRDQRFALEQKIYDGYRANEARSLEIADLGGKIVEAEQICTLERTNLLVFRRQKNDKLRAVEAAIIYSIPGFGLQLLEPEARTEEFLRQLEGVLVIKKKELNVLREDLTRPIEIYTDKLRILLSILEERDRQRKWRPPVTKEVTPPKSISITSVVKPPTPPPPFDYEAYYAERLLKLVTRFFLKYFAQSIGNDNLMRKWIPKVARILGNIGRNFTGELANNIIEVLIENLQRIVPKKVLVHATLDDYRSLFKDVIDVFIMEPVEVNPFKVISEAVDTAMTKFLKAKVANKTQRIIFEISKILVHELPMDDFRNLETPSTLGRMLANETVIIPNCYNPDTLITQVCAYAKSNLLSHITQKITTTYAQELQRIIIERRTEQLHLKKPKVCRDIQRRRKRNI